MVEIMKFPKEKEEKPETKIFDKKISIKFKTFLILILIIAIAVGFFLIGRYYFPAQKVQSNQTGKILPDTTTLDLDNNDSPQPDIVVTNTLTEDNTTEDSTDADDDGHFAPGSCWTPADDCNDSNPAVNPAVDERRASGNCADALDNDCDGLTDSEDPDCAEEPEPCGFPPSAEASVYGTSSAVRSGALVPLALFLIPVAQVFLLKMLRRKKR